MKRTFLFSILCLFTLNTYSQKVKKETFKSEYPSYKETYYVLKDNNIIKHGEYKKFIGGSVYAVGNYDNGKKTGVWDYYGHDGQIAHKFDYAQHKLIYNKNPHENSENKMTPPVPLGGMSMFYKIIGGVLRYPADARKKGTQGKVFVKFTVGVDGKISDIMAVDGIEDGCREETERTIKLIHIDWVPGKDENGNAVPVEMILPITFKLG